MRNAFNTPTTVLQYKSVATALLFSVLLGPVGLLYSSFRGGLFMIVLGIIVISNKFLFPVLLLWLACCVWAVGAVEAHNRKITRIVEGGSHYAQKDRAA